MSGCWEIGAMLNTVVALNLYEHIFLVEIQRNLFVRTRKRIYIQTYRRKKKVTYMLFIPLYPDLFKSGHYDLCPTNTKWLKSTSVLIALDLASLQLRQRGT